VLFLFAGIYLAAAVCWLAVDSETSIVSPGESSGPAPRGRNQTGGSEEAATDPLR
jgi:hypothetical protein